MSDMLEQFGTQIEIWYGAGIGNRMTTFFISEKNGSHTALGLIGSSYISQPFDHYPSRLEVEEHAISDPSFTMHFNVVH
ncbi:MAG: hypothetical protein ABJB97_08895 [Acidobacteriota bacterium]